MKEIVFKEGRGNWMPPSPWNMSDKFEMVYVDLGDYEDEFAYDDFKLELETILESLGFDLEDKWLKNEARIVAEKDNVIVAIADNQNTIAVAVMPKEAGDYAEENEIDSDGFYITNYENEAKQIFKKLSEIYELSVRTGAWTSGKYIPENEIKSLVIECIKYDMYEEAIKLINESMKDIGENIPLALSLAKDIFSNGKKVDSQTIMMILKNYRTAGKINKTDEQIKSLTNVIKNSEKSFENVKDVNELAKLIAQSLK